MAEWHSATVQHSATIINIKEVELTRTDPRLQESTNVTNVYYKPLQSPKCPKVVLLFAYKLAFARYGLECIAVA